MGRSLAVAVAVAAVLVALVWVSAPVDALSECGRLVKTLAKSKGAVCVASQSPNNREQVLATNKKHKSELSTDCGKNARWVIQLLSGVEVVAQNQMQPDDFADPEAARTVRDRIIGEETDAVFKVLWPHPQHIFVVERVMEAGQLHFYLYQTNINTFTLHEWLKGSVKVFDTAPNKIAGGGKAMTRETFTQYWQFIEQLWALLTNPENLHRGKLTQEMADLETALWYSKGIKNRIKNKENDGYTIGGVRSLMLATFPHLPPNECQQQYLAMREEYDQIKLNQN